jgi:hypothetical protein
MDKDLLQTSDTILNQSLQKTHIPLQKKRELVDLVKSNLEIMINLIRNVIELWLVLYKICHLKQVRMEA